MPCSFQSNCHTLSYNHVICDSQHPAVCTAHRLACKREGLRYRGICSLLKGLCSTCCRASEYSGRWTFGELIHYFFGRTGSWFLRLFIFINNAGLPASSVRLLLSRSCAISEYQSSAGDSIVSLMHCLKHLHMKSHDSRVVTAGLLITYTIMLGDVLVGKAPEFNGFITNLVDIHSGDVWYLDRRFVVRPAILAMES